MVRRRGKSKGSTVSIDWSGADIKNFVNKEGEFLFKVTGAEEGDDGQIIVDSEVIGKVQNGKTIRTFFNTQPQSLWVLGNFLEAIGMDIPESEEDLDLEELIDQEFVGRVEEHEWDDKTYMRIRAFMPADEFEGERAKGSKKSSKDDDDEEEEKPARGKKDKKGGKKGKAKLTQDEVQDMDEDELEALVKEHELDVDLDDYSTLKKKRVAVIDAAEELDLIEE